MKGYLVFFAPFTCYMLSMPDQSSSIITVQQHIMREQKRFPGASGEFSFLLSGITLATKMISAQVRRAGLTGVLGEYGDINVQGEIQQKLDVLSNEALVHCLSSPGEYRGARFRGERKPHDRA